MKIEFRLAGFLLSLILSIATASSQHLFKLERENSGHYYIATTLCGEDIKIMLESGIPAFLIDKEFYERHMKECGLTFKSAGGKMRLHRNIYNITMKAEGSIRLNNAVYDGPIWVLEDFRDLRVPIQYLKDTDNGNATVTISLKDRWMKVGDNTPNYSNQPYKLGTDKSTGCPAVQTEIALTTSKGKATLKGLLNIDFGNPMLLALEKTHKGFSKAIDKGEIQINDARDKDGNVVAQGIYAETLSLLNKEYKATSILVHPQWGNKKVLGLIGLPFFQNLVFFDFGNHTMIVQ